MKPNTNKWCEEITPEENCPLVRVRAWVRVRVGGGASFLVSNCPRT